MTKHLDVLLWRMVQMRWKVAGVPKAVMLLLDSHVAVRYGEKQAGAEKGYNPKKPGRRSHHPLMAFLGLQRLRAQLLHVLRHRRLPRHLLQRAEPAEGAVARRIDQVEVQLIVAEAVRDGASRCAPREVVCASQPKPISFRARPNTSGCAVFSFSHLHF